jgi:hypothetical protein
MGRGFASLTLESRKSNKGASLLDRPLYCFTSRPPFLPEVEVSDIKLFHVKLFNDRGIRAVEVSQSVEVPGTERMYGRDTCSPDLRGFLSFKEPGWCIQYPFLPTPRLDPLVFPFFFHYSSAARFRPPWVEPENESSRFLRLSDGRLPGPA